MTTADLTTALTAAQRDQWVAHRLAADPALSHLSAEVRLHGPLDEAALRAALHSSVERHPALRTAYLSTPDGPIARVVDAPATTLTAETPDDLRAAAANAFREPFDVTTGRLLRARLFRIAADEHLLCLTVHRLGADEASLDVLLGELAGRPAGGTGEPVAAPVLQLPADRQRPAAPSPRGGRIHAEMAVPGRTGTDPGLQVTTALAAVLSRYTGVTDLHLGLVRTGRSTPDEIGPLARIESLRVDLGGDPGFAEAVRRCELAMHGTREARPGQVSPVVLELRDAPPPAPDGPLRFEPLPAGQGVHADLRVTVTAGDPVTVTIDYNTDLFDAGRIERLAGHLRTLLAGAAADPDLPLSALPLLTGAEEDQLRHEWQGPPEPYSCEPVHQQISAHARTQPDAVALRFGDDEVTYAELDRRAGQLARRLRADGTRHGDIVAICLDRGIDVVVAMVGVLRAGAAFAVLDPAYPVRRSQFLIEDTAARTVITQAAHLPTLPPPTGWSPLCMDRDWPAIAAQPTGRDLPEWAGESSLAYVLYTSGSTGQPKGVLIEHGSLSNFVHWPVWLFGLGPGDRMLQHMTLIFDFSEGEIFTALTAGATLVIAPEPVRTSPAGFARFLADERITCVFGPPAVLAKADPGGCPDLRYVVVGGDICTGELVNRWNTAGRRFINGYGPTEATVGCTAYECEHREWTAQPPIGRPMPNRAAYILDPAGRLCPAGVPGELYIGGAGVARGYLNRPDLTRERFLADPFRPGERMYRTGDLAAWTADGQIQFLGRIDTQVKVNGLRVELEEIEAALYSHPSVAQAAVSVQDDTTGNRRLVAHVVPAAGPVDPAVLRSYLGDLLPAFLVPGRIRRLSSLPLTPVGKVDRARLHELITADADPAGFRSARTPREQRIAAMLAEVLGRPTVGVENLIFDLGGTSLSVVIFTERINRELGARLQPRQVYEAGTVAGVCRLLDESAESAPVVEPAAASSAQDALDLLDRIEQMSADDVRLADRGPA